MTEDGNYNDDPGDVPDSVGWKPLIPFLDQDPKFCFGVEFGMWYAACRTHDRWGQHVRTENEEQMRLTCSRLRWEIIALKPWDEGPPDNGWVYLGVRNPNPVQELT